MILYFGITFCELTVLEVVGTSTVWYLDYVELALTLTWRDVYQILYAYMVCKEIFERWTLPKVHIYIYFFFLTATLLMLIENIKKL